jgi:ketosteroid isomerase-like protein
MSQENIIMVGKIYAAFARGDVQTVFASFSPEIEWQAAENSPAAKGSLITVWTRCAKGYSCLSAMSSPA